MLFYIQRKENTLFFLAKVPNDPQFHDFCEYMTGFWSTQNISVHAQLIRTNNSVESFHNYLFSTIGGAHPNVWIFLHKIKKVEHSMAVKLNRVQLGVEPLAKRQRVYRLAEQRIRAAETVFTRSVSHQSSRLVRLFSTVAGISNMLSHLQTLTTQFCY